MSPTLLADRLYRASLLPDHGTFDDLMLSAFKAMVATLHGCSDKSLTRDHFEQFLYAGGVTRATRNNIMKVTKPILKRGVRSPRP